MTEQPSVKCLECGCEWFELNADVVRRVSLNRFGKRAGISERVRWRGTIVCKECGEDCTHLFKKTAEGWRPKGG